MKTTKTIFTPDQINVIKNIAKRELTKRGIHVSFEKFEVVGVRNSHSRFEITSNDFQTVPVLFASIRIESFSNSASIEEVEVHGEIFEHKNFWITIGARYENFNGGSNGVSLFEMFGYFEKHGIYSHDVVIR